MKAATTTQRATQILMAEHEVILTVLDCLEQLVRDPAAPLDQRAASEILDFLGNFADRCHHGKEEECLFPALTRKGLPREVGPVAVMLAEHDQGRAMVRGMREALSALAQGRSRARDEFAAHARGYVALLRDHIAKENGVLFPMADGMLGELDQAALLEAFGKVEHEDMGAGTHERYIALVGDLVTRLGVQPRAPGPVPTSACCGHGGHKC
jgi:hemerythrin-like domain-containing protein